jgi:hypothetical protein
LRLRRAGECEAFLLTLLCAYGMYHTLYLAKTRRAIEVIRENERLAWTFHVHPDVLYPALFIVAKYSLCLTALMFAARLAQHRPRSTVWFLRALIACYAVYAAHYFIAAAKLR